MSSEHNPSHDIIPHVPSRNALSVDHTEVISHFIRTPTSDETIMAMDKTVRSLSVEQCSVFFETSLLALDTLSSHASPQKIAKKIQALFNLDQSKNDSGIRVFRYLRAPLKKWGNSSDPEKNELALRLTAAISTNVMEQYLQRLDLPWCEPKRTAQYLSHILYSIHEQEQRQQYAKSENYSGVTRVVELQEVTESILDRDDEDFAYEVLSELKQLSPNGFSDMMELRERMDEVAEICLLAQDSSQFDTMLFEDAEADENTHSDDNWASL